jgi:hypothetical protein
MKKSFLAAAFVLVSFNGFSQNVPTRSLLEPILGVEDEQNLMCILPGENEGGSRVDFKYKNELNPLEEMGVVHNRAMDHLDKVLGEKFEVEQLIREASQYFSENQNLSRYEQEQLQKTFPAHMLVKFVQGPTTHQLFLDAGEDAATALKLCLSGFRKRDMSDLINFENRILISKNTQDPKVLGVMALASVCRHTAFRNALKVPDAYFDGSEEGEAQLLRIEPKVIADAAGAVAGVGLAFYSGFGAPVCLQWGGYFSTISSKLVD